MKQITVSPANVPYTLLSYGVDTLVLNVRYADSQGQPVKAELPEELAASFDSWQAQAKEEEKPVEMVGNAYKGCALFMHPHGAGKGQWRWLITCDLFNLCVSRGRLNGIVVQVRLSSQYLWSSEHRETHRQDLQPLLSLLRSFLSDLLNLCGPGRKPLHIQVSEIHLCADVTGWDVAHCYDWQATMLSRARRRRVRGSYTPPEPDGCQKHKCPGAGAHGSFLWSGPESEVPEPIYYGHTLETIEFGSHGSPLSCVIYNKTREIKKSGKTWFLPIWASHGHDGESEVYRIEYRWKREALHDLKQEGVFHGIETLDDLFASDRLSSLWTYAAGHVQCAPDGLPDGWLRYTVPTDDQTPSRWPVHPAWQVVQAAFTTQTEQAVNITTGEVVDLPVSLPLEVLIRDRKRNFNLFRLTQQIAGCSATLAAHLQGRSEDRAYPLPADSLPFPEEEEELDLVKTLFWLAENIPAIALKTEMPEGATRDDRQAAYDRQFAETMTEKRILYGLQSTND